MRRLFWLFLILFVVYLMALAGFQEVRDATYYVGVKVIGEPLVLGIANAWTGIAANPTYQAWHMLIWFAGGIVFLFAAQRLISKRPAWMLNKAKVAVPTSYQNQPIAQAPVVIQQPQQSAAPVSPKPVVEETPKEATA